MSELISGTEREKITDMFLNITGHTCIHGSGRATAALITPTLAQMVTLFREPLLGHHVDASDIHKLYLDEGDEGMAALNFVSPPSQPVAASTATPAVAPVQPAASEAQPAAASEAQPATASEAQPAAAPEAQLAAASEAQLAAASEVPPAAFQAPPVVAPAAPHVVQEPSKPREQEMPPGPEEEPPPTATSLPSTPNTFGPGTPLPGTPLAPSTQELYNYHQWPGFAAGPFFPEYVPSVAPAVQPLPYLAAAPSASYAPHAGAASWNQPVAVQYPNQPVAVQYPPQLPQHGNLFQFSQSLQTAMFSELSLHLACAASASSCAQSYFSSQFPANEQLPNAPTTTHAQCDGDGQSIGNSFAGKLDNRGAPTYTSEEVAMTREFVNVFAARGASVEDSGAESGFEEEAWGSEAEEAAMLQRIKEVHRSHPRQKRWRPRDMPPRNKVHAPWEMRAALTRIRVVTEQSPDGQQINVNEIVDNNDAPGPMEELLAAGGAAYRPKVRDIVARTAVESLRCRDLIFQNMDSLGQCLSVLPDLDVHGGMQLDDGRFKDRFGGDVCVFLKQMFEKHHGEAIEVSATWNEVEWIEQKHIYFHPQAVRGADWREWVRNKIKASDFDEEDFFSKCIEQNCPSNLISASGDHYSVKTCRAFSLPTFIWAFYEVGTLLELYTFFCNARLLFEKAPHSTTNDVRKQAAHWRKKTFGYYGHRDGASQWRP